ncbi:MAG: asparagine synthetase B family protein [Gemmatimonadaceae bacterium]
MSGVVALLGDHARVHRGGRAAAAGAMLGTMRGRGDAEPVVTSWSDGAALLAVSRLDWELAGDFSGAVGVLAEHGLCVAADASIYHRAELRRRLEARGVPVGGDTASHFILAAYRVWGTECASHLEGDFAFVIWDAARRRAVCARDSVGRRALHYARCGDTLVVASSVGGVLAHPGCSHELNLTAIGALAAGMLWSAGAESCYQAVRVLPAAHTLVWTADGVGGPMPHWQPPVRDPAATVAPPGVAAEELRELLQVAVSERLAGSGITTVWMSGGWDSTAVFAAGEGALGGPGAGRSLQPVSISYPAGDPGREDELITDVAGFWGVGVHWLDIADIPLLDGLAERAAATDEPPAHLYESWNRALARGTRACGARIALDGSGGDQLFQVSDILLADLLRRGHWRRLAREARARRARGIRHLFRNTVEPLLPLAVVGWTARCSGSTGGHYMERPLPSWIRPSFAAAHDIVGRDRACLPPRRARDRADAENRAYFTAPMWAWGGSYMSSVLLEEGVESRSPLLDRRVIEFALRRPVEERASGGETKLLLRRSMRGLLPDHVLAPRAYRTGVTAGYSRREMRAHYPALFDALFRSELRLAELGVVEPAALRLAIDRFMSDGGEFERVALFHTIRTELWLRAHRPTPTSSAGAAGRTTIPQSDAGADRALPITTGEVAVSR